MKVELEENELDDWIIETVLVADRRGKPIEVSKGYRFEKNLKSALQDPESGLASSRFGKLHQSVICTKVRQLIDQGFLRYEDGEGESIQLGSLEPVSIPFKTRVLLPA